MPTPTDPTATPTPSAADRSATTPSAPGDAPGPDGPEAASEAPSRADVVVVGGGAIGLASAWRLAQAGRDVAVVDDAPGRGASWAAAGMLAPVTEIHYGEEQLLRLNLASSTAWPDFAAEIEAAAGRSPGFRENSTLVVARDRDELDALDRLHGFQRSLGLDVERLGSRECRELEPGLAPGIRAGLLAGDHQVDNRALVGALLAACDRAGVVLVAGRVATIARGGAGVAGVDLVDGGRIDAPRVVLAAGAWSSRIGGLPDGSVPVHPVKGELLHLRAATSGPLARLDDRPPLATRNIRAVIGRPGRPAVYVVPRGDGRAVVGATADERGFDLSVTAGGVLDLLREAYELLPAVADQEFVEATAGLRPGTPDNAPLLGPGPLEGLVLACGHFRNGILLTPVTAEVVAAFVADGTLPEVARPFTGERFSGVSDRRAVEVR